MLESRRNSGEKTIVNVEAADCGILSDSLFGGFRLDLSEIWDELGSVRGLVCVILSLQT